MPVNAPKCLIPSLCNGHAYTDCCWDPYNTQMRTERSDCSCWVLVLPPACDYLVRAIFYICREKFICIVKFYTGLERIVSLSYCPKILHFI